MKKSDLTHLQNYYEEHRAEYDESFRLRIHRALSWLRAGFYKQKKESTLPLDTHFIHLWIAFNAAYANKITSNTLGSDKSNFRQFLLKICQLDHNKEIYNLVWNSFSGNIRTLLKNPYTFQSFWDFHNGIITKSAWQELFEEANNKIHCALASQSTELILFGLFDRLYILRNQLIHGGATFNSKANRQQLKDACLILSDLIPIILQIMMQHHQHDWGKPSYPFIKEN